MKAAVLFHRLGPYHYARLTAAARIFDLTAVEFSSVDPTYAWDTVRAPRNFALVTLFHDSAVISKPTTQVGRRISESLDAVDPDVVAIPGWADKAAWAAIGWCTKRRVPAIMMSATQEIDEPREWWREEIKKRILGLCKAGLVGGSRQANYLAQLGMPSNRIFHGYNVVDNAHFLKGSDAARHNAPRLCRHLRMPEKFFLSSNRFVPKKNLLSLVRAYARYRRDADNDPWSLVILGDGVLRPQLESLVAELNLQNKVHLPGFKQYPELPSFYGLAGAYIQSSTTEPWGLVVNEAMAAGLPVIVSDRCGCVPELVKTGVNGYSFDPYDEKALAQLHLFLGGM